VATRRGLQGLSDLPSKQGHWARAAGYHLVQMTELQPSAWKFYLRQTASRLPVSKQRFCYQSRVERITKVQLALIDSKQEHGTRWFWSQQVSDQRNLSQSLWWITDVWRELTLVIRSVITILLNQMTKTSWCFETRF